MQFEAIDCRVSPFIYPQIFWLFVCSFSGRGLSCVCAFCVCVNFAFSVPHQHDSIKKKKKTTPTNPKLNTEYDPNPLKSLGKRNKRRTSADHRDEPSTSAAASFSFQYDTVDQSQLHDEEEAYKYVRHLCTLLCSILILFTWKFPSIHLHCSLIAQFALVTRTGSDVVSRKCAKIDYDR